MKIGLQLICFDWPGSPNNTSLKLAEIAKTADKAGFYSLWVMDHFFQMGGVFGSAEAPMLEGYTAISYLAGLTQQIKLGVLVTGNLYRHPGILVKSVTTLDVLSGGRAYFGIGAGWYEREAKGLGVPFPSLKERFERLEEALQITHQMWQGDTSPYHGKHYQLSEPINHPPPLSQPHPPILIGGEGEKKMMPLIARYGDACNFYFGATPNEWPEPHKARYQSRLDHLHKKLDILEKHCNKIGRSFKDIEKTVLGTIKLSSDGIDATDVIELCRELTELGFHHVIFNMPNVLDIKPLEIFGQEIIPVVNKFV